MNHEFSVFVTSFLTCEARGLQNMDRHQTKDIHDWLRERSLWLDGTSETSTIYQLALGPKCLPLNTGPFDPNPLESRLRVLTLICQKIGATGSGVVVREVTSRLAEYGIDTLVVSARYAGDKDEYGLCNPALQTRTVLFKGVGPQQVPFPIPGMSDRMPYESIRFRDLDFRDLSLYLDVWRSQVVEAVRLFQPHVIHVHHLWLLAAVCAATSRHIPIVVSVHGTDLQQARLCGHLTSLVAPWIDSLSRCLFLSDESLREATELYPQVAVRALVLGNGYNDALFLPKRTLSSAVLRKYGIANSPLQKLVLFVGKFVEWKGVEWLLRAYSELKAGCDFSGILVIGGTGPEAERLRYLALAVELGIANQLIMTGEIDYEDVGSLMNIADVFVLPSHREPFGLVLLEAIACGARVISTNQGGPAAFVPRTLLISRDAILIKGLSETCPTQDERNSFVKDLALAIGEQVKKPLSFEKRCEISASVKHLTWDAYVQKVRGVYRELTYREGTYV